MLKNIILILAIFVVILLALSFGATVFQDVFIWISDITGVLVRNFDELFSAIAVYLHLHTGKVLLALLLTIPVSFWVLRSRRDVLAAPSAQRKIAIILALCLGWLGAHRFYLGQFGWGLGYLLIWYWFTPLAVVLGLIDAIRYLFMDDESFSTAQRP